jgi:hypothetical protein
MCSSVIREQRHSEGDWTARNAQLFDTNETEGLYVDFDTAFSRDALELAERCKFKG